VLEYVGEIVGEIVVVGVPRYLKIGRDFVGWWYPLYRITLIKYWGGVPSALGMPGLQPGAHLCHHLSPL